MSDLDPKLDGVTHINIYSKGKTRLGTSLSNFASLDFESPTGDGRFLSVEGYWYWLLVPRGRLEREKLRYLSGWDAKKHGKAIAPDGYWQKRSTSWFQNAIMGAIENKVTQHGWLCHRFVMSSLPLKHYYVSKGSVNPLTQFEWIVDGVSRLRREMKRA